KDILPAESILLSSTIGTNVLVLIREQPQELIVAKLKEVNTVFMRYYKLESTIAISSVGSIVDARSLYRETQECIAYRFYMEEGSIITKRDVRYTNKHSSIVNRLLQVIEKELCNSLLSLNWVATEVMFMNVDYLGKLFKKEVGEKFSNYVMKLRME